ncbi:hypothetical protein EON80_03775 [bacterium]|nr:MAG: hypothetical protein EON80_03775 [bacterium]
MAQPVQLPEPLYAEGFEQGIGEWRGLGPNVQILPDGAPENVKQGVRALRFDYRVSNEGLGLLVVPIAPPALATLKSISFWVKSDHSASLALVLKEENGGRFTSIFSVIKGDWQKVEITPADFVLQSGPTEPQDDNGRLDTDKIENVALVDFSQIFAQGPANPDSPVAKMLGIQLGPRTLYLDDLVFSSKSINTEPINTEPINTDLIDDFSRPQAAWFSVGAMNLRVVKAEKAENNALQADYSQVTGRIAALAKLLRPDVLKGKAEVSFDITSKRHATLIVQLEEHSGGKYNAILDVPASDTPALKTLKFADFKASDDSKDNNGQLNLDQVKQLLFIDFSGMLGAETGDNVLSIQQIRAK